MYLVIIGISHKSFPRNLHNGEMVFHSENTIK